jgi:hypothetical protein
VLLKAVKSDQYACAYATGIKVMKVLNTRVAVVESLPALGTLGLIALAAAGSMLGFLIQKKRA